LTLHFQRAFVNLGQKARKHRLNVDYRILIVHLDVNAALTFFDAVSAMQKPAAPSEFFSRAADLPKTNCKHGSQPAGHKCKCLIG
jgi:hypothetical protein